MKGHFLFATASRPDMGPPNLGDFSRGQSGLGMKLATHPHTFMVWDLVKHGDNFTYLEFSDQEQLMEPSVKKD